jgi:hypothetical protein
MMHKIKERNKETERESHVHVRWQQRKKEERRPLPLFFTPKEEPWPSQ